MAVVLDAAAIYALASGYESATRDVGAAVESEHCYITVASVVEAACLIADGAGKRLAETWIAWLYTNDGITVLERSSRGSEYTDEQFVLLASEAYAGSGLTAPAASAAAAARMLGMPILTDREKFRNLEAIGFCQVRWIR